MSNEQIPEYSLVVPIYNEEETLPELLRRVALLLDGFDGLSEVILVDDGSSDGSYEYIARIHDEVKARPEAHGIAAAEPGLVAGERSGVR
jgi:glycosyltransferase involved in cell wall biosynthesis